MEVSRIVHSHRKFAAYHLHKTARVRDVVVVGGAGQGASRIVGRHNLHVYVLPVLLLAVDLECVSAARENADVFERQVAVRKHIESVLAVVVVRDAVGQVFPKLLDPFGGDFRRADCPVVEIYADCIRRNPLVGKSRYALARAERIGVSAPDSRRVFGERTQIGAIGSDDDGRRLFAVGGIFFVLVELEIDIRIFRVGVAPDDFCEAREGVALPIPVEVEVRNPHAPAVSDFYVRNARL